MNKAKTLRQAQMWRQITNRPKFSPDRFSRYAQDLALAVYELSRENGMGATSDLRNQLGNSGLYVRFGNNRKFVTMGDNTVEVDVNATNEEVAKALNLQKIDGLTGPQAVSPPPALAPKPVEPIKKNLTGASFLANLIRTQQAKIKEQLSKAGDEMTAAMTELQATADHATSQVKAVMAETADLKAALGLNSNGEPE